MAPLDRILQQGYGYVTLEALQDIINIEGYILNSDELLSDMDKNRLLYFEVNGGFGNVLGVVSPYGDELHIGLMGSGVDADSENGLDYIHQLC